MFDALSDRLDAVTKALRAKGRLTDRDLDEALGEVRTALLEADVELTVVRAFIDAVRGRLTGASVSQALSPGQQVVKAVHEQLVEMLGGETLKVTYATADLQRPAAVEQLRVLGERAGVEVYSEPLTPLEVARTGVQIATLKGRDVVIIDTAGRLSIDEALMDEVRQISDATSPHYTFLVIDAMTGQDAVHTARAFHDRLSLSGLIVTKLDYDARGGAVLSAQGVVGRPVVFASTGEKLDDFDLFHPERMASRILGMGDVLTLIEEAERKMDADVVGSTAERLMSGQFTLDDFLAQMVQVRKMGSLGSIMKMLPGVGKDLRAAADSVNDKDLNRVEAIIHSMTPAERRDPALINGSRRLRIAQGSGTTVPAVNNLLRQFTEMQKMMKQMASGSMPNLPGGLGKLAGRMPPGAMAGLPGAAGPRPGGSSGGGKKKKKGGRVTPPKNG